MFRRNTMLNTLLLTLVVISVINFVSIQPVMAHPGEEDDSGHQEEILIAHDEEDGVTRPAPEEHHEVGAQLGHKLHPIHADNQARISGWLTVIAQGTIGSKDDSGRKNDLAEGSLSGDIFYEASLNGSGKFMLHLDIQQGEGLVNTPALFASPNGNVTGPNNDVESFLGDQVHLAEAWYETKLANDKLTLTFGQLDPTVYFDTNNYANNERFQFIANLFGNNTTIEFGGTGNFYGAGFRLTYSPSDIVDITLGALDGDGNYREMFDRPFVIAEMDIKPKLAGKEGNYRFYVWQNSLPHYRLDGDGNIAFVTVTGNPSDSPPTDLIGDKNTGFGISLDQVLTDNLGLWARLGIQDGDVSQFGRHISGGVQISGGAFGRPDDVLGLGLALTMISDAYKDASSGMDSNELYAEAYYNIAVKEGFQVTPDIEYIVNPGGDGGKDSFAVFGVRAGVMF